MDGFLAQNWSGLVVAAAVLVAGGGLLRLGNRVRRPPRVAAGLFTMVLGGAVAAIGALLLAGSLVHLVKVSRFARANPPPGKLIDVGGYRLHLACEGPVGAGPTWIWIPGGSGQGLGLAHLHRPLSVEVRSCLFDRAGTGWSDVGPLPKTTARQIEELDRVLTLSGERGPFVLAGHSAGGFLAMNYAARHADRLGGLLLMDPPTAEYYAFGATTICPLFVGSALRAAWLAQFGILWREPPPATDVVSRTLEPVRALMRGNDAQPRYFAVSASMMRATCAEPLDLVRGDQALGALAVYILAPDSADRSLAALARPFEGRISPFALDNLRELLQTGAARSAALSRQAKLFRAGPGTTHQFPYEDPGFVIARARELIAEIRIGPTQPEHRRWGR